MNFAQEKTLEWGLAPSFVGDNTNVVGPCHLNWNLRFMLLVRTPKVAVVCVVTNVVWLFADDKP